MPRGLALLLIFSGLGLAQATPNPSFIAGFGAGYKSSSTASRLSAWTMFGSKVTETTYITSSTDINAGTASFRQGIEQIIFKNFGLVLTVKGDAGVATNSSENVGGAFAGGSSLLIEISRITRVPGTYVMGSVTYMKTTIDSSIRPVYRFGLGIAF